jgi:hypothetical protein
VSDAAEQVRLWSAFAARVRLTFPFPRGSDRAEVGVELHVLERDTREPITVHTRRPAPWTNDEDAIELVFDLLDVAMRHEIYESVWLDRALARELHKAHP